MIAALATLLVGLSTVYFFSRALLHFTQDAREPPAVHTSVPFVSPLIGLGREGLKFWVARKHLPIYTLRFPFTRLYIVNSTALVSSVQRQVRSVSFSPVLVRMASSLMGVSKPGLEIIARDSLEEHSFVMQTPKALHPSLSPGAKLNALNTRAVSVLAASLEKFGTAEEPSVLKMNEWIRHQVMMATTEGIYGPGNPFRDPAIRDVWHKYETGLIPLMMSIAPALTARESLRMRETLVKRYERYYDEHGYLDPEASAFIKDRYEFFSRFGLGHEDIARLEVASSIALIGNTMPATFWLVFHILSDKAVLEDCRGELSKALQEHDGVCTFDVGYMKSSCPIFFSTFQEVLRFHGIGVSARVVTEDATINDQYLLKKGGIVLIPGAAQHHLSSAWGEKADTFDHRRFVPEAGSRKRRYDPAAFRGFGGGSTLCPGRHFASTEMLAFTALIVLRFEIQPRSGRWVAPTTAKSNPGTSVEQPDYDIDVEIRSRDHRRWAVTMSGSDKPMMISAEDIAAVGAE
ncbi:cytochrome P450 [Durotheca rogersii]|uniref:cytochrome P450 n=1 Tax=Durotheca rogersii TaxID=419775 RepID=UPI00221F5143|nr:cytochrome P450 [Durotheca rogersii]KAI5861023.1 cytochrome P450 [Durotheca rogersii]